MAGALLEAELMELAAAVGFRGGRITERFDCYRGTPVGTKVSEKVGVHGANFLAFR